VRVVVRLGTYKRRLIVHDNKDVDRVYARSTGLVGPPGFNLSRAVPVGVNILGGVASVPLRRRFSGGIHGAVPIRPTRTITAFTAVHIDSGMLLNAWVQIVASVAALRGTCRRWLHHASRPARLGLLPAGAMRCPSQEPLECSRCQRLSDAMTSSTELVEDIARSLLDLGPNPIDRWSALERSWPHDVLVAAARTAISRPVWQLPDVVGSIGMVTGSGGLTTRLPNISTAAALVASCADGIHVVKPGSSTSRTKNLGPGGLAHKLGLRTPRASEDLLRILERDQFAVIDTDGMYPWIGVPEAFTVPFLCEALDTSSLHPCSAQWKVNGVADPDPAVHLTRCRNGLHQRTLVVHGRTDVPGFVIDDVSTAGTTFLLQADGHSHSSWSVEPEELGVDRVRATDLVVAAGLAAEDVFISILDGSAPRAWIDAVAASAGTLLWHARISDDLASGFAASRDLLQAGVALRKLRQMQGRR